MDSFETARQHFQAGRFAQAEAVCRQILAGQPQDPSALCLLGQIMQRRGSAGPCGATHFAVDPIPTAECRRVPDSGQRADGRRAH